jgi:hypothetical protein
MKYEVRDTKYGGNRVEIDSATLREIVNSAAISIVLF